MNTRRFSLTAEVSTMQHPAAQPRGATMIVNTRAGQGPAPCTNGVDCPEPEPPKRDEDVSRVSVNVHVNARTPIEAVVRPESGHAWVTIGTPGTAIHITTEREALRLTRAFDKVALRIKYEVSASEQF